MTMDIAVQGSGVTQATEVERARAVAEVQAAVIVAQQCPRDLDAVLESVRDACMQTAVAERAFYSVPNRGTGASVHLAREIARIYSNVSYGVRELRRDDIRGESEIEAWAWDQQLNVRTSRTFQVPHQRMAGKQRRPLTDLTDVYLNNQNIGARAVRECIFAVLPDFIKDEAERVCRHTLETGDSRPIAERIAEAVGWFETRGISSKRLESRIGKPRSKWTSSDLASLHIDGQSITREGIDPESIFGTAEADTLSALEAQAGEEASE